MIPNCTFSNAEAGFQIYVTVGSEEKRLFLQEKLNIPASHIFSSRNTDFADAMLASTNGRGVDVILSSLTGELLDETWRICADGGILVDIGRGLRGRRLSPGPFERNCLVKAFDLTSKQVSDDLIRRFVTLPCYPEYLQKILTFVV
jgi:NADPH:quinone reductase-like Zn-dependent oxidoreductase